MLLFLAFGSTSQHLIGQLYIGLCNILRHSSCFSAIFITLVWGCLRFLLLSSLLLCVSTPNTLILMSTPMSGVCSWISKIRTSTKSDSQHRKQKLLNKSKYSSTCLPQLLLSSQQSLLFTLR
jgi:hypothetical protein